MKNIILFSLLFLISFTIRAQVAINTDNSAPDASAMLDVKSTTSGLLIPRMTAIDRDNIASPATGLTVYVTDDNAFYYFDGTSWIRLQEAGKAWLLNGNAGTTGTEFLGTTDAQSLIFKTNNVERMQIKDNGVIGINTAPNDSNLMTAFGDTYDIIGSFASFRLNSDDIGVFGQTASSDYYGYGGYFVGGYVGVSANILPTGSNYYYGISSNVDGGTGNNYGVQTYINGGGTNFGNFNNVNDDGNGNAINFGSFSLVTGDNENYGFAADLSGTGTNYGFYGAFDAPQTKGSIGFMENSNADGIALFALSGGVSTYYGPTSGGAAIAATGDLTAIAGYSSKDDSNTVCVEGTYQGAGNYADATGVLGYSAPADSYGYGVKGIGGWVGVYGETDSNGLAAIYANGDLLASGTKNFIIDHPQDPANKYLKHFSIESNEVLNVYRGIVRLDANGSGTIEMPSYFKLINKNYSYQLTPIGSAAPGLYVSKEINNHSIFKIAGGQPGQKISWVVYAERNDPYLQQHPEKRQVEVPKKAKERGKYLMPELYNQPDSKAMVPIHKNIKRTKKMQAKKLHFESPEKRDKKYHQKIKKITKFQAPSSKK